MPICVEFSSKKGGDVLLTAGTKTGKIINLALQNNKADLLSLRGNENFVCQVCGETVILKLGDQRIFHFAHKKGGTCSGVHEPETLAHMSGKLQLYHWLIHQNIPAILEYYDRDIQQRPDIMFEFNGQKFALEFQCSVISEENFVKRTIAYMQNGYKPLWILVKDRIHLKKSNILSLSNFHFLFLRSSLTGGLCIPAFCPEKQQFYLIKSIIPFSVKNAFFQSKTIPLKKICIESLLDPSPAKQLNYQNWCKELDFFIMNWVFHPEGLKQKAFLQEIYTRNLNPFLLPPEIGLPVPHTLFFQTPIVIWQTYIFIDILTNKFPKDTITLGEITHQVSKRMKRKEIILRNLPQLTQVDPLLPVMEYLQHLENLGVLVQKNKDTFQLQRKIAVPNSNCEKEEAKRIFHQKNYPLFRNI